ncbi:Oligopeptide transporter OPT superfamily [Penicillium cosmopolitanum]|uniref:Oligopeptide transporter OPT superfamily n=1 Tax=Penicillium cosmopolitanum TaxID=1131564 RepID=A0A9X0BBS1_9EURO|nr:Oligopeptide transporter OPT superfamily [Penicillium cosmopolitanum]KAJ5403888.1 Oligopeptide transporter OPT superfamily [Penicillium cosmopolitanum]
MLRGEVRPVDPHAQLPLPSFNAKLTRVTNLKDIYLTWIVSGLYVQFYLRNYRPRIFKDYSYLVTGAFDGASLTVLFILSFAVFGAGGPSRPFPSWWGNNVNGNYDWCPTSE